MHVDWTMCRGEERRVRWVATSLYLGRFLDGQTQGQSCLIARGAYIYLRRRTADRHYLTISSWTVVSLSSVFFSVLTSPPQEK